MNRAFEKELSRALAAELDTAAPKTLLRRCRAEYVVKRRSGWRDLLHCQFKLLGWKVWALEAMAVCRFYTGQVNIRCLNWNKPHMQESVVRW